MSTYATGKTRKMAEIIINVLTHNFKFENFLTHFIKKNAGNINAFSLFLMRTDLR